jgi:hypothetical protein
METKEMILRNRLKEPNTMMSIGLVCLILGNVSHYFLHPTGRFAQSLVDGTFGLFLGVSIGCLLLSVRQRSRRCSPDARGHATR